MGVFAVRAAVSLPSFKEGTKGRSAGHHLRRNLVVSGPPLDPLLEGGERGVGTSAGGGAVGVVQRYGRGSR